MVNVLYYDTIQDLINSTITPDVNTKIVVLGYHEVEDNGGGTFYWVPGATESDDGGTIFSVTAFSTGKYKRIIGGDKIKASWFGAKADGVTDDTQALKNAILYVRVNSLGPTGRPSTWGQNTLILDKGDYLVTETLTDTDQNYIGFSIIGAGEYATQITFRNDTDPLFHFRTYINITFSDFIIYHDPIAERFETNNPESNWTNTAFFLRGQSGGRRFTLKNITITNFDTQIRQDDSNGFSGNGDTNLAIGCSFINFTTFLYSRNTQAVVNEYLQCSWSGGGDVFDIAGYGITQINSGNIVVGGTWFKFANVETKYGASSSINLNNVKGEYAKNFNQDVFTRIIDANGSYIICNMIFNNCGITKGETPDPNFKTFVLGAGGVRVLFNGGAYEFASLETIARTTLRNSNRNFIKFEGCYSSVLPSNITRTDSAPGAGHPSISYTDCNSVTNITLLKRSSYAAPASHVNTLTRLYTVADGRLNVNTNLNTTELEFYDQETIIEEIMVAYNSDNAATGQKGIRVFSDAAKTNEIGALTLQGTSAGVVGFIENVKGVKVTEGLYFDITNADGAAFGKIIIKTYNI